LKFQLVTSLSVDYKLAILVSSECLLLSVCPKLDEEQHY